jgi:hypothetical protein
MIHLGEALGLGNPALLEKKILVYHKAARKEEGRLAETTMNSKFLQIDLLILL